MRRILLDPGPRGRARVWLGEECGRQRVIFLTGGNVRFYLTVKAFGWRIRLKAFKPFVQLVRT